MDFRTLDNRQLQVSLKGIAAEVRKTTAEGIAMLAEVGRRELHLSSGYRSLFLYCTGELGFSKSMAWRWSKAAEAATRDHEVVARVSDGRLSLCVAATLASHPELLKVADGMTKDEADAKLATLKPGKTRRDVLPALELTRQSMADVEVETTPKKRLHVDVSEATLAKAHRALELLPGRSLDDILGQALDGLLEKRDPIRRHQRRERRKAACEASTERRIETKRKTETHRKIVQSGEPRRKRHSSIPLADRDAATAMAGGRCEYVSQDGKRCSERSRCERDHIHPLGLGGVDIVGNTRHLCHAHHRYLTRLSFPTWRRAISVQVQGEVSHETFPGGEL